MMSHRKKGKRQSRWWSFVDALFIIGEGTFFILKTISLPIRFIFGLFN